MWFIDGFPAERWRESVDLFASEFRLESSDRSVTNDPFVQICARWPVMKGTNLIEGPPWSLDCEIVWKIADLSKFFLIYCFSAIENS